MNPTEATIEDFEESPADTLRENTQLAQYEKQEQIRQSNILRNQASLRKNKDGSREPQLSLSTFALMFLVAILFDLISFGVNFLPVIGGILADITIEPIAILTFFIWLKMHGINFTKGTRGLSFILTIIIGFIPILNALPEWTVFVLGLYLAGTKISTSAQKSLKKVRGK